MYTKVVSVLSTGASTQDITFTPNSPDPSWTPKIAIFQWSRANTSADTFQEHSSTGIGFTNGTNSRCVAYATEDNQARGDAARIQRSDGPLLCTLNPSGTIETVDSVATFNSWLTNGIRINWTDAPAANFYFTVLFLGGDDITNVDVGTLLTGTGTGDISVTSLAYQPDFGLFLSAMTATDNSPVTHGMMSIGAATSSSAQWNQSILTQDNPATMITRQYYSHGKTVLSISSAGSVDGYATFSSFNANGFTFNVADAFPASHRIFYLVIKGGAFSVGNNTEIGSVTTQTVTTNKDVKAVGIFGLDTGTADAPQNGCMQTIGLGDSALNQNVEVFEDTNGVADSVVVSRHDTNQIYLNITANATATSSTLDDEAALSAVSSTGFTLNWTNVGQARPYRYITFGTVPKIAITKTETLMFNVTLKAEKPVTTKFNIQRETTANQFVFIKYNSTQLTKVEGTDTSIPVTIAAIGGTSYLYMVSDPNSINGVYDWQYGIYTIYVRVVTPNSGIRISNIYIARIDPAGNFLSQSNSLTPNEYLSEAGKVHSFNLDATGYLNPAGRSSNDRIALYIEFYNASGSPNQSVSIGARLKTERDELITPIKLVTSIQKTNTLKYDLRYEVTDTNTIIQDIRKEITDTNTIKWNILTPVATKINTLIQHIRQELTDTNTTIFNIRKELTDTNTLIHNIRQEVTDTNTIRWDEYQSVTKQNTLIQHIRQMVLDTSTTIFNIIQELTDTNTLQYNIRQEIVTPKTLTLLFQIRQELIDTVLLTLIHDIRQVSTPVKSTTLLQNITVEVAAKIISLLFDARQTLTKTNSLIQDIRQESTPTKTNTLRYAIVQELTSINNLLFDIEEQFIGTVTKTSTLRFNVSQLVIKTLTVLFNELQELINISNTLRYDVLQQIEGEEKQNTLRFDIRQEVVENILLTLRQNITTDVTKSNSLRFNITKLVEKTNTLLNNILEEVTKSLQSPKFNIEQQTTATKTFRFDVEMVGVVIKVLTLLNGINNELTDTNTIRFNITNTVEKQRTFVFSVLQGVAKQNSLIFHTLQEILPSHYKSISLRQDIQAEITKAESLIFKINQFTQKSITLNSQIYQKAQKDVTLRYDLIAEIGKTLALQQQIYQEIEKQNDFLFRITKEVSPTGISKTIPFDVISQTTKLLRTLYDIRQSLLDHSRTLVFNILPKGVTPKITIHEQLLDFIFAHWEIDNPATSSVLWHEWYNGQADICIDSLFYNHFTLENRSTPIYKERNYSAAIHIFYRDYSDILPENRNIPRELANIINEIQRILLVNKYNLYNEFENRNVFDVKLKSAKFVPEENIQGSSSNMKIWHYRFVVEMLYQKII